MEFYRLKEGVMSKLEHWYFERVWWYSAYCCVASCLPHGQGEIGSGEGLVYMAAFATAVIMMCVYTSEHDSETNGPNYDIREASRWK
jgi:hypothetical protein